MRETSGRTGRRWIAVVVVALVSGIAAAQEAPSNTVQELMEDCEDFTKERVGGGAFYCLGLAAGTHVVLNVNCTSVSQGYAPRSILRAGAIPSIGAAAQAFVNWARAHPQKWAEDGRIGMIEAIIEAFPCEP